MKKIFLIITTLLILSLKIVGVSAEKPVFISEIGFLPKDKNDPQWIEIMCTQETPLNLKGYSLWGKEELLYRFNESIKISIGQPVLLCFYKDDKLGKKSDIFLRTGGTRGTLINIFNQKPFKPVAEFPPLSTRLREVMLWRMSKYPYPNERKTRLIADLPMYKYEKIENIAKKINSLENQSFKLDDLVVWVSNIPPYFGELALVKGNNEVVDLLTWTGFEIRPELSARGEDAVKHNNYFNLLLRPYGMTDYSPIKYVPIIIKRQAFSGSSNFDVIDPLFASPGTAYSKRGFIESAPDECGESFAMGKINIENGVFGLETQAIDDFFSDWGVEFEIFSANKDKVDDILISGKMDWKQVPGSIFMNYRLSENDLNKLQSYGKGDTLSYRLRRTFPDGDHSPWQEGILRCHGNEWETEWEDFEEQTDNVE